MKAYNNEAIAMKMGTKLSGKDGQGRTVIQHNGKWYALTQAEMEQLTAPPQQQVVAQAEAVIQDEPTASVPAPKAKAAPVKVTITLPPGSYESKGYIYTPAVNGKQRWFATKNLDAWAGDKEHGIEITTTERSLKSRGLDPSIFASKAEVQTDETPAAEEAQAAA